MAHRPSSIDALPDEIRSEVDRLRLQGRTIDEIVNHLREMHGVTSVSRSAMGRHVKKFDTVIERLRTVRAVSASIKSELGDAPESEASRLNGELLQGAIFEVLRKIEDGEEVDPKTIFQLAQSLNHLAKASATNVDFIAKLEKRAAERAKAEVLAEVEGKVAEAAKEAGLSKDRAAQLRRDVLGLRPEGTVHG